MATNFEAINLVGAVFSFTRGNQAFLYGLTPGDGDGSPPVVTLVSPPDGSTIEQGTPIAIDVTDNVALRRSFLVVRFAALGIEEVAHQGDRFAPNYAGASSRVAIPGGFRFTLMRAGGWPASPIVDVYAIDTAGSEAA